MRSDVDGCGVTTLTEHPRTLFTLSLSWSKLIYLPSLTRPTMREICVNRRCLALLRRALVATGARISH
jgi:hypothetical protein